MQTATLKKEGAELIKLNDLADSINNEFRQSNSLAVESIKTSGAAVKSALRTGQLLNKAKSLVGHSQWLRWMASNCPDIDERTAQRWMKLSKTTSLSDLGNARTLTEAYRTVGMIPETEKAPKAIGTAEVDIFTKIFTRFEKGLGPVIDATKDVNPEGMPAKQRSELLKRARPMVEFIQRVEALEVVP